MGWNEEARQMTKDVWIYQIRLKGLLCCLFCKDEDVPPPAMSTLDFLAVVFPQCK